MKDDATVTNTPLVEQTWVERMLRLAPGSMSMGPEDVPSYNRPAMLTRYTMNAQDIPAPDLDAIDWGDAPPYEPEVLCLPAP